MPDCCVVKSVVLGPSQASIEDVMHGVKLAKKSNLKITIRSGGHS